MLRLTLNMFGRIYMIRNYAQIPRSGDNLSTTDNEIVLYLKRDKQNALRVKDLLMLFVLQQLTTVILYDRHKKREFLTHFMWHETKRINKTRWWF